MCNLIVFNDHIGIRTTMQHVFKMFEYLATQPNFKTIHFNEFFDKTEKVISNIFIEKCGCLPKNIIFFEHLTEMAKINIPKEIKIIVLIDDLHHQGRIKDNRINGLTKVSKILSTYGYCFHKYYSTNVPIFFFPHSAAFESVLNNNPINKILVSGRLNKDIYPFRQFVYNLAKSNKFLEYLEVNHKYEIVKDDVRLIYGQRYINKLNKYIACFTCDASHSRPYIVGKHFEILLSGSLLVAGNINTKYYFQKLGFIDGEHYISVTIENIQEKIKYIVDPSNRENIDKIRKNGYELAKLKHMYQNRAKYLMDILEENSSKYQLCNDGISQSSYFLEKI